MGSQGSLEGEARGSAAAKCRGKLKEAHRVGRKCHEFKDSADIKSRRGTMTVMKFGSSLEKIHRKTTLRWLSDR
jgi:hypothetical protein